MIERDKEYYNQKISELYAVIENQEKIIRELQEKINTYENPEDLTLFYMWIDNKAKDKMKDLQQRIDETIKFISKVDGVMGERHKLVLLTILKGGNNE